MTLVRFSDGFSSTPSDYVFCVTQTESGVQTVTTEKKGVWTWIQANILYPLFHRNIPNPYSLSTVLTALEKSTAETGCVRQIVRRITLKTYLKRHPQEEDRISTLIRRLVPNFCMKLECTPTKALELFEAIYAVQKKYWSLEIPPLNEDLSLRPFFLPLFRICAVAASLTSSFAYMDTAGKARRIRDLVDFHETYDLLQKEWTSQQQKLSERFGTEKTGRWLEWVDQVKESVRTIT